MCDISRALDLLLDLAEVESAMLDEYEAADRLTDFRDRARNLLQTWPERTGQAPAVVEPEVTSAPVSPASPLPVAPKGQWTTILDQPARDPAKADPTLKRFVELPR